MKVEDKVKELKLLFNEFEICDYSECSEGIIKYHENLYVYKHLSLGTDILKLRDKYCLQKDSD